jgi:hypothetical protein
LWYAVAVWSGIIDRVVLAVDWVVAVVAGVLREVWSSAVLVSGRGLGGWGPWGADLSVT